MQRLKIKRVNILINNPKSWFLKYGQKLEKKINNKKIKCRLYTKERQIKNKGDVCFYLSCTQLTKEKTLKKFTRNVVVHASNLPKGKGFSPWIWNIIEGKNNLTLSVFEIDRKNLKPDSGAIYLKSKIKLNGTELLDDIRNLLGEKINELCMKFLENINNLKPKKQIGKSFFYKKRYPKDQEINLEQSLLSQINTLRTADNERWPAYFIYKKRKYFIKIYK